MPIKKYMLHVDGKDRQVSVSNIDKYGMDSYAKSYPDATIRMRDDKDVDYDIPISEYQRALDSGLHAFTTNYYKDKEEEITERSTFKPDSVAYMDSPDLAEKITSSVPETNKTGTDTLLNVPETDKTGTDSPTNIPDGIKNNPDIIEGFPERNQPQSDIPVLSQTADTVDGSNEQERPDSMINEWNRRLGRKEFIPAWVPSEKATKAETETLSKSEGTPTIWDGQKQPTYVDYINELVNEWGGFPTPYPETRGEKMLRESSEKEKHADKIWEGELKPVVDNLIEQGKEEGRKKVSEYQKTVYGNGGIFSGAAGMGDLSHKEYAKATDAKKVIDGVQKYLSEKSGNQVNTAQEGQPNQLQERLMQKVYDYLVDKSTPKSTAEYIMRSVFSESIMGQLMSLGDQKSYEQRQIEAGGLQKYQPSAVEEVGAMAASIGMDLPVMAVTGTVGGLTGNTLLKGATNRLMASGLSESAASGIATRAAQQTGMRWALRTVSEAVNFGTLEGLGNAVGQVYQTGDIDMGKVATSMAKGAATGAIMGVFGVSNDKFRGMMEGGLGETAGRAIGYTTSLGGRTAILTGSSVLGQYLEDPNFDINNVDWTKEIVHAGLMNLGFDILGAVKKYQAYKRTGIRMRDIEKLHLTEEDVLQLNQAGINGKNAQEIAENILQIKDFNELRRNAPEGKGIVPTDFGFASQELGISKDGSVLGQLLSNENIDLGTKSRIAYLMTGIQFRLAPNTNVSGVQEQNDGSFTVEKFNPSGQTNETKRFKTREEAEKYRRDSLNEIMSNQVGVLEGMMDNAGKVSTATRIFDMVGKMYNATKEQIAEAYAKGRRGEELDGLEKQAYKTIDDLLRSISSVEDYHYSVNRIKSRIEESYNQESGWLNKILKKKYNSLNETERRAYDEYVSNMKEILQGNQADRTQLGEDSQQTETTVPLLPSESRSPAETAETKIDPPAVGSASPSESAKRANSRNEGTRLYAEHDPAKMRQAVVRERVAYMRLYESVFGTMTSEDINALVESDDAGREEILSALDENQRRLAEDYLSQADLVEGLNDAIDEAHNPEVEAAEVLVNKMTSQNGNVMTVTLGKYGDNDHEYGIIVSGIGPDGNPTSPEGQVIVVPVVSSNWTPDYTTFDESNAISMVLDKSSEITPVNPDIITESMLGEYQADVNLLGQQPLSVGQQVILANEEGNTANAQIVGQSLGGGWLVLEEGQSEPMDISNAELEQMVYNAEKLPILQEYAKLDAEYERNLKEIRRQSEKEAQKVREAEEAARIAEEMKRPINRLVKYPEGHERSGKPDYESSKPEDVRDYLVESLGLEGAVKSIRSQRKALEKQEEEQISRLEVLRTENEHNDYFPDEAIAAKELMSNEEKKLDNIRKSLNFWRGMETLLAGPEEKSVQQQVSRSVASQKAVKTKNEVYKPSAEYEKIKKGMSDSEIAQNVLNDLEPHTPEELAAQLISSGVRLMKADEQVGGAILKGVQSMTGYSSKDLQRMNFVFATRANGGVSVSEFGELLESAAVDSGVRFDGKTQEEGVNALLSLLGEVETMGDITRYIEKKRIREARRIYDEEESHIEQLQEDAAQQEYGMSYAEYKELQEAITGMLEIRQRFTMDFWESEAYSDFISNFATNKSDNGIEGKDNTGITEGSNETVQDVPEGTGRTVEGNQESSRSIQPTVEVAASRQQDSQASQFAAENGTADGNGNDTPVFDRQGAGNIEGSVIAEHVEQAKQLTKEVIEEVKKEIQGRPVYAVGSLEDIEKYKKIGVGGQTLADMIEGFHAANEIASYIYDLDGIIVWAHKAAEYGVSKRKLKASIYHENVHALLHGNRYTTEEFQAFAEQIRRAFPDIAEYVDKVYGHKPESIQAEEVVTRYVEELVDSRLEEDMLAGGLRIEGDTDAIGEELDHIVNLLKDRKYEREGRRIGSDKSGVYGETESENGGTGNLERTQDGQEKQESVHSMERQGNDGDSEGSGMAGSGLGSGSRLHEQAYERGRDSERTGRSGQTDSVPERKDGYQVEKRHHDQRDKDIYAVKFTERFDREKFLELKDKAKEFGGYYSRFGKGGFIFNTEADANAFAESVVGVEASLSADIAQVRAEVNTNPTEVQKKAGNYKMGHLKLDGYDITIENPKGSVRSGKDTNGKEWHTTMNNDYGYIRGTKAVDGDHIDVFLSDKPEEGRVFVVDQTNQDGSFDESKVMYGFNSLEEARDAYLSNYDSGWESRIMAITEVSKEDFKKWIDSSTRKTKAFSEYKSVKTEEKPASNKEIELKPTYDEQGRETIESQAGHSRSKAEELGKQIEAGSVEDAPAERGGRGTSGNRPAESNRGSEAQSVNGFRLGEKVLYNGKEATITDFDNERPVLDTGMAPVIYEIGRWQDVKKLPSSMEQVNSMAEARTPEKNLERVEQRQKRNRPKRAKQKEQMANLFGKAGELDEALDRQEQEVDAQLALLGEYKAGPKAQVREDMHTGAAKTLEKSARKFAKGLAAKIGGHVDGKDISHGLANIASVGGNMAVRIWTDEAETAGVYLNISFNTAPDTREFDKLVPNGGYWRTISDKDKFGINSRNRFFDTDNIKDLESGVTMTKVGDEMLSELNRMAKSEEKKIDGETKNEVLTHKKENDERRSTAQNQGMGREARQEAGGSEPTGISGGGNGYHVPDTQGSGGISERDGKQPVTESVKRNTNNWSYGNEHLELPSGEIGKLKGNIEAIRTLKELEENGQPATPEQKQALLKFVGWGGLAEALNSSEYAAWQSRMKNYGWSESLSSTPWGRKWGKHYEELRPLMTDEEWATAQASTLNSHYTPETVIRGLWEALEYMGFKGGSIQEPAMGVGHILGFMPNSISERSTISGFELDSIPGRIAKQLYPDANITVAGYETVFRPGTKDAIVTNVPFGQTAPVDPALDKTLRRKIGAAYNLHNYFIIKGLLELKPGGVGAFVTSSATMDGRSTKAREYIAGMGVDLIGAIRLPNNTFKSNAGTEVTADILFFRKRLPGEQSNGIAFASLMQIGTGSYKGKDKKGNDVMLEAPLLVNEYFAEHPEMMLGTVMTAHDAGSGGLYGGDNLTLVARPGTELCAELADAIGRLPENALAKGTVSETTATKKEATGKKNGTLSVKDGKVYVASNGELAEVAAGSFKHNGKTRSYADATTDYQAMKDTLKELIQAEQTQQEDPAELRKKLNKQYDSFVEKYGRLNENKNLNVVLEEDAERFLPQALEKVETVTNPTTGRRTKVVSKGTGILTQRVSQPLTEPDKAESLGDAIGISQAYRGRMDVDYIGNMLGISADEARERILNERQAYEDPVTGDLVDRDAYLSGNIRDKLETARNAAETDSRFETNVSDLEKAMPESIPFVDIHYKLGTPWIPTDVYERFAEEVLGIKNMRVKYIPEIDQFVLDGGYVDDHVKASSFKTTRRETYDLMEDAINLRKPTIMKKVWVNGEERSVKDEAATQEAISAIMDMGDAFVQFIQEAKDLHTRLSVVYNDRYNNYRLREYREPAFKGEDGKIHYPNSNMGISLRDHQVKAVQRCLQGGCTLLAHQVGTGKTFTMITAAMEMRRLGLAKKPMIVVQNATLQDFASDFMKLYPSAKILVPNETERSASQRKRLFNLIATGDFDAIIVPQSFLAFIPDDEGRKKALIKARVDEILTAADAISETDKRLADRLKKEAKNLELSLSGEEPKKGKRVKDQAKKEEQAIVREIRKFDRRTDDVLTFEQMGVDALFIDEAHNYKKIGFSTKMQNVKGVDTGYSERANSLYLKVTYVQEKTGGRNVVLATGTPITNTMAEVWTMMRFVAPEILEDYNIRTFDEFAATFGQVEPSLEQNSTGGFKISDRFKSYVNVPELVKAFRSHADVVLTSDVKEFKESKNIPKLKDGQMTNHVIQKSDKLQEVMDVLISALAEDEKKSGKEKTPGLPLVVFSKAKQAAIDLRLINPEYPDDPDSKTNKVVSEVMRIYKESTPDKGIQMVFCDSYQSPASEPAIDLFDYDPNVPQFNLYRDIKQKLVVAGIPKEEIVIVSEITNAERKKAVFEKARSGAIRVLIGGTEKMGVGVNVQDRMIALHHMDAPIRPMDFEQRNGRILRQGNMFAGMDKPVEVLTYGVEGTLDATAYERLRIKQDFINQMMKGDVSGRVMEESDDEDPSGKTFSQMAAELSGDKTLQLLFVAENKMKKLEGLRRSHELKKTEAKTEVAILEGRIAVNKKELKQAEKTGEEIAKRFPDGITKLTINGRPVTEKLGKVLAEMLETYEERYALNRSTVFPRVELNNKDGLLVFGHNEGKLNYTLYVDDVQMNEPKDINTYAGVWVSLNNALSNAGRRAAEIKQRIASNEARLKGAESLLEKEFDKMEELKAARQEVKKLKEELAKKAEPSVPSADELKLAKKNLKDSGKPVSLQEEKAGDSEESLDRMEAAMKPFEEIAVNAPEMVVAMGASDILKAMPGIGALQFAQIVKEANRPEVQAMYVPWTRQIVMLPTHGTVKEMRDKRWHESFHFGIDMVLPKGDEGRLMLERAASEADKLAPSLSKWVEDTYGEQNVSEEKVVHLLEDVLSYMEDNGKVKSLRGGLDFGSQYPVLNEIVNKVINYLTNNGNGKENNDYSGYDERDQQPGRGENQVWRNEKDFSAVRGESAEGREAAQIIERAKTDGTYMKAPNGKPTNLTEKQWVQVRTKAFKKWFGDWENDPKTASKVIDENGEPKVVYHNSHEEWSVFDEERGYIWAWHDNERPGSSSEFGDVEYALFMNIRNPFVFDAEFQEDQNIDFTDYDGTENDSAAGIVSWAVEQNSYDGVIIKNIKEFYNRIEGTDYVSFKPNQIKSATDNAGTFDELNTDIRFSLREEVDAMVIAAGRKPQMRQEGALTDADIDALNRELLGSIKFGLRGKPRRKAGESLISYNRRLKEWQAESDEAKRTRAVENMDMENPLDTELNDLAMEMMNHPSPIRRRGESDEDFNARQAEWSEWYNTRRPEIERRIAEIKVLLENEKAAARKKEMDRTEDLLYTGEVPPQKDDEGQLSDEEMREVREIFQEKMYDMGIAIDKEQAKRDIKQEIIERRRYIETSNLEDTFFVDKVKKVAGSKEVLKAIPDYIEGTYTGEVSTELVEASKLVSDWFEEVYNLMAMEGVLYDAAKIQNYVTHIWDWKRSPMEAQQKFNNYVNTMRLRSPFTKHRVVPTYKEGIAMGMVPKYEDITGILQEYGHYATETIANKRMVEFLKTFKVFVPGGKDNLPMEVDLIVSDKVKDPMYQRMNHTALDGYKVLADYHKYIKPVFGDQRILDHKQMSEFANKLTEGIWTTSGLMKKIALSFSFFHHGALTETAIAMMKPHYAAKAIAKNLIWDVITKGNIPALNDKEAARDAVKHLVSLGASNDYVTADVNNLTSKLYKLTKDKNIPLAKQATQLLDFLNRGSDKVLWDIVHDGFKIASYKKMAEEVRQKAEREGWNQIELEKALDECGHLVNDTFGGLHFDILGYSPKEVRIMRALLLSPDWTLATIRQALSPFGFGKLYGDEGFWKTIAGGENPVRIRKKYGRQFWITAMIFFYALTNGLNAYFRVVDEDEQKRLADETRKTNPDYKSPYELAYPDGMKWYDYTMPGNTLSHQTHLFTGRYEDGTETYARWGKQFRELPELFFGRDGFSFPGAMIDKMSGKANPLLSTTFEIISGYSLSGWENQYMKNKKGLERDLARLHVLASKAIPYSIPSQEDKEWYWLDLVMPSSKGFTPGKAINYYEKAIESGDFNFVAGVYNACVKNGLDPEKYLKIASSRIEATSKANMLEGVETLQDAAAKFDETEDVKEKKRYLKYMEQQIGAQDYHLISQEELLQQAKDIINGEPVTVNGNEYYLENATSEDVMEDYRMKKNAAGLKKYYQDYTELMMENPEAGRRMLREKRKFIEGYQLTTKYRSAINRAKKIMKEDNRLGTDNIMKEIRRLRKEYFKKMDEMELK